VKRTLPQAQLLLHTSSNTHHMSHVTHTSHDCTVNDRQAERSEGGGYNNESPPSPTAHDVYADDATIATAPANPLAAIAAVLHALHTDTLDVRTSKDAVVEGTAHAGGV
jgi:hypothetical protein